MYSTSTVFFITNNSSFEFEVRIRIVLSSNEHEDVNEKDLMMTIIVL